MEGKKPVEEPKGQDVFYKKGVSAPNRYTSGWGRAASVASGSTRVPSGPTLQPSSAASTTTAAESGEKKMLAAVAELEAEHAEDKKVVAEFIHDLQESWHSLADFFVDRGTVPVFVGSRFVPLDENVCLGQPRARQVPIGEKAKAANYE